MTKLSKLLQVSEEQKKAILASHGMTVEEFDESVRQLKEWVDKSEHLPKENDENKLRVILLNSKMSIEKAKQCLEGYYRVRTTYSDFFDKMLPFTEDFEKGRLFCKTAVMPKLTPDLCRITIYRLSDPSGICEDALIYQLIVIMVAEIRISNDCFLSNTFIIDFEEYGWKNILKYTPMVNQKLVNILVAVNLRIHSIHFVNTPPFIDHVMGILKMVMPAKIVAKIHIHKDVESLHKAIPRDLLPKNYGGTEETLEELYEEWCEELEENEEHFRKLLNAKSTKKNLMDPDQREMFGIGTEGSFKKLAVD